MSWIDKAIRTARAHPCLLAGETTHPRYQTIVRGGSVILTLNSGYE
jgi:hypothetical protein